MPPPGVCLSIRNERNRRSGRGSATNPDKFLDQDFDQLHQGYYLKNDLFIDRMFPPEWRSIGDGLLHPNDLARIVWRRPGTMVKDPYFILDGVSRFDVRQGGIIGNCWFLASIGALTFQEDIKKQIIPEGQSFKKDYAGIFHFRFWRFGKWVDVVIDDTLPTIDGRLIFVYSKTPNEFWAALMEKAYAKVCGSYADMNAGSVSEALMDLSGGIHMTFKLDEAPPDLWDIMDRAAKSASLMACGTPPGLSPANTVLPNGIVHGHAYTITGLMQVMSNSHLVRLVRLLNPWGHGEWKEDWSDKSSKWKTVSLEDRTTCLTIADDGEFWMSMEDFCKNYSDMDICSLSHDFLDGSTDCHWPYQFHKGRWVTGATAGGCSNYKESFWTNPQYHIQVETIKGECAKDKGLKNLLVSLMQKSDKRNRRLASNFHIGFSVFSVPPEYKGREGKFPAEFFMRNPVASTKKYLNAREVMEFFRLVPGEYIIVPSTFKPNETASFILAIHSKTDSHLLDENSIDSLKITEPIPTENMNDNDSRVTIFQKYTDQYEEVDAEQLQRLLNENLLQGKSPGFGLDTCRSMVTLMDLSVTGHLNHNEFLRLWDRVVRYREIFYRTDTSRTGDLSLSELRNAVIAAGIQMSDDLLNLMALRYGGSTGSLTLESFVSLILRLECMSKIFRNLSDGKGIYLQEKEVTNVVKQMLLSLYLLFIARNIYQNNEQ
ncbi:calpain-1 catalytic subunit-like isoform X1 [Clupea harengus]|uniref:Calpain-1 catalytic subunit-like isoform X1 n=1 Tax=Clupea harengus TaxID=7950 RepID=A0A6P8GPB1_CLUHA|nr:calpain-1 catalytic subunit-like isoform X1 [Clupea harengus]